MMETKIMPRQILGIMEKHIEKANTFSLKNIEASVVTNSDVYDLLSSEQKNYMFRSDDIAYLDGCVFNEQLYFIIMDEFLFIKCKNSEFTIDGVMSETLYNEFRDLILKKENKENGGK